MRVGNPPNLSRNLQASNNTVLLLGCSEGIVKYACTNWILKNDYSRMDFVYSPPPPSPPPPISPSPPPPLKELWKTLTYERSYFYVKYLQIEKNVNMRAGKSV